VAWWGIVLLSIFGSIGECGPTDGVLDESDTLGGIDADEDIGETTSDEGGGGGGSAGGGNSNGADEGTRVNDTEDDCDSCDRVAWTACDGPGALDEDGDACPPPPNGIIGIRLPRWRIPCVCSKWLKRYCRVLKCFPHIGHGSHCGVVECTFAICCFRLLMLL